MDRLKQWSDDLAALIASPLPLARQLECARSYRAFEDYVQAAIDESRARPRDDFMSDLIRSVDSGEVVMDGAELLMLFTINLILAGHETTANALTWTWHLLAQHPEVEARMHEEIDAALGDRPATLEDLPRLGYVEQVLTESMRIWPPVWLQSRKTLEDYPVGDVVIPEGSIVFVSQYLMHRDPRFFDDPETFRPERWMDGLEKRLPRGAFIPFGMGSRKCIGSSFALMEATILLATIARRWRFELEGTEVPTHPAITLRPATVMPAVMRFAT